MSSRILLGIWALLLGGIVCLAQVSPMHVPIIGPIVGGASVANTWSTTDKANTTLSNGNLTAAAAGQGGVRSTKSYNSNKCYAEITIGGTIPASPFGRGAGLATGAVAFSTLQGNVVTGSGFGSQGFMVLVVSAGADGQVYYNGTFTTKNIGSIATGNVISYALDFTSNKKAWARLQAGNWLGDAAANPATNTNGVDVSSIFPATPAFMAAVADDSTITYTLNVGGAAFAQSVPSGFAGCN